MSLLFPPQVPRFDVALRDARSPRASTRLLAAQALANPPPEARDEACALLRVLADDADGAVRSLAIAALGELGDAAALELVLAHLDDPLAEVREFAVIALGRIGGERAVRALARALRDARPEVRFQAVESYAEASPDDAPDLLVPMLGDADARVREHTLDALGALAAPETADAIAVALRDATSAVRFAAALALARLDDARGVAALVEALDEKDRVLAACEALAQLRAEAAREPLAELARRILAPLVVKAAAAGALAALGDSRGEEALRAVLTAFRADGRSYAAELVGRHRVVGLAEALVGLLERPRGADPVIVARALAALAPHSDVARAAVARLSGRNDDLGRAARGEPDSEGTR